MSRVIDWLLDPAHRRSRIPSTCLLAGILLSINEFVEWPYAVRFMFSPLDAWAAILLWLSIPVSVGFLSATCKGWIGRVFTLLAAFALLMPVLLLSCFQLLDQNSFRLQHALNVGPFATYRVYFVEPGFSVISPPYTALRKEIDTFLGIKLVRTLFATEVTGTAVIRQIDDSTLELEIDGDFFRKRVAV